MLPIFSNTDYGKDEDTSKGMVRRNTALTAELNSHATKVKDLLDEGNRYTPRKVLEMNLASENKI